MPLSRGLAQPGCSWPCPHAFGPSKTLVAPLFPLRCGTLIASLGTTVSDPEQHRVALEAQLLTLEEQLCDALKNSRTRYLLQIEHARLMTELLQLKIEVMRGTLAGIRRW